jgi:hypothetical protein
MKTPLVRLVLVAALASVSILPAHADRGRPGGRIIGGHFDHHEWRGGRWIHGPHDGHLGWWWVVAGTWFLYPRPIYPYPPVVVEPRDPAPTVVQPEPQTSVPVWYYCPDSDAYYPYVQRCRDGWRTVPAVPPGLRDE